MFDVVAIATPYDVGVPRAATDPSAAGIVSVKSADAPPPPPPPIGGAPAVVVTLMYDELVVPLEFVALTTITYVTPSLNPEKVAVFDATPWSDEGVIG